MPFVYFGFGIVRKTESAAGERKLWMNVIIVLVITVVFAQAAVVPSFAGELISDSGLSDSYDGHYLGDIDANGVLEPSDARRIHRIFEGLEPLPEAANNPSDPVSRIFDVNGDGEVSAADAVLVMCMAGGQEPLKKVKQTRNADSTESVSWSIVTEEKQTENLTEPQTAGQTEKATEKTTEKTTEKATEKQTEKTTDKATEKQTDKQTVNQYVPEQTLKICTYNVGLYSYGASPSKGGLGYRLETDVPSTDENKAKKDALYTKKTGQVKRFFASQGFDILGLQENMYYFTRKLSEGRYINNEAINSIELFLDPVFPYVFQHSYGCGLVLCSRYEMSEKKNGFYYTVYNGNQRYYQSCVIYPNGKRYVLVNTHLQPVSGSAGSAEYAGSIAAQEGQMAELVNAFADEANVIIFADWNRRDGDYRIMTNAGYTMLNGCNYPMEPSCRQSWKRPTVNTATEMDPTLYREYLYAGYEEGYEWGARYLYENGSWVKNQYPDGDETDICIDNIAVKGDISGTGRVLDVLGDMLSDHLPFVANIVVR